MSTELIPTNILDLTSKQTLFELAIADTELIGHTGAKLIADLKERAGDAEYTHMYYRDPIRPGIVWFADLYEVDGFSLPTRGKLDLCRQVTENVFPGFLKSVETAIGNDSQIDASEDSESDNIVMAQIPPLVTNISGIELSTALEYLVFVYPSMVRAWAALIFTYDQVLGLVQGAESTRDACITLCPDAQVIPYLMGKWGDFADVDQEKSGPLS